MCLFIRAINLTVFPHLGGGTYARLFSASIGMTQGVTPSKTNHIHTVTQSLPFDTHSVGRRQHVPHHYTPSALQRGECAGQVQNHRIIESPTGVKICRHEYTSSSTDARINTRAFISIISILKVLKSLKMLKILFFNQCTH